MPRPSCWRTWFWLILMMSGLGACAPPVAAVVLHPPGSSLPVSAVFPFFLVFQPLIPSPTFTPHPTFAATPSLLLLPTPTPGITPTQGPLQVHQGPGEVTVPILLYHHIAEVPFSNPYYLSPAQFEAQMTFLWQRGYRTISVAQLLVALENGADLPACPLILTFDDGDEDVYTQAFPILQRYGYTATVYLVVNYLDRPHFLRQEQVQALLAAGWEVGSHSLSHPNLTQVEGNRLRAEIVESRTRLEALLGTPVLSFAYPYGEASPQVLRWVQKAGYQAGMGVGPFTHHRWDRRYFLARRPIEARHTVQDLATFLPWPTCDVKSRATTPALREEEPGTGPTLSPRRFPASPMLTHPRLEGVFPHSAP